MTRPGRATWLCAVGLALAAAPPARAQGPRGADSIRITTPGPAGAGARVLRAVLAMNPEVIRSDTGVVTLARGERHARPVLIFAEGARVAANIAGDVVVVGGDLFVHPGAQVEGRAIAIGGGVYPSTLATIRGERRAFRDGTFVWSDVPGGLALDYRPLVEPYAPPLLSLPMVYGVRLPGYDRVDGLSLRWGPMFQPSRAITFDPTVTWRSHRGAMDPWGRLEVTAGPGWSFTLDGGRETRTNERWIRGPIANSLASFLLGSDAANYYRAEALRGQVSRAIEMPGGTVELTLGAQQERATAAVAPVGMPGAGSPVPVRRRAWSLRRRDDVHGMRRPNPFVPDSRIASAFADVAISHERAGITTSLDVRLESPWQVTTGGRFQQVTLDGLIAFPTFGAQRFEIAAHWLTTAGDTAPPQRWSWLGGEGTLPTFALLQLGGDELLFLDSRYIVPLPVVTLPMLGSPVLMLRHIVGTAGVGTLPALEQNLALRLQMGFLRAEFAVNPRDRARDLDFGFTFSR